MQVVAMMLAIINRGSIIAVDTPNIKPIAITIEKAMYNFKNKSIAVLLFFVSVKSRINCERLAVINNGIIIDNSALNSLFMKCVYDMKNLWWINAVAKLKNPSRQ